MKLPLIATGLLCLNLAPMPAVLADELEAGFAKPPAVARPQTFWYWMNGNVTRDGITRDLEAMKQAGLAGALIFEGGIYIPRGPVDYLNPEWRGLMVHAAKESDRLGLQLGMHNAPGWSSSGGPWIKPEDSMKQLVWTEITVTGSGTIKTNLTQPYTKEGFYRDAVVLAFPALLGEDKPQDRPKHFEAALADGDLRTGMRASPANPLVLEFAEPFEARAITLFIARGTPTRRVNLEASDDGVKYRPVVQVNVQPPRGLEFPGARNFPPVRAKFFRLVPQGETVLAEVALHHAPRIEDWNYKGNYGFRMPRPVTAPVEPDQQFVLDPKKVRDISSKMDAQGRLRWRVPKGSWVILRLGYTSTGQRNIAAPAAGAGLECDKFSQAAVEKHFHAVEETVLKLMKDAKAKSFMRIAIDSYEAEFQNWTAAFPKEFKKRNGYDILPYLPALTGRIVGSADVSDRFLYDVRRTEADLMVNNYYGHMGELCRRHGLQYYVEPYGPGTYDELEAGGKAGVPVTEFWTRFPWGPSRVVKSVSSSAHIYGKSVVAAESFTGEEETSRWEEYPYALKTLGDQMFSLGYNQTFFHRNVHHPHPDAMPGMTMGPWGMHLDRMNTWFSHSGGWMDYLSRSQYMLQQGNPVSDVLYFVGERTPEAAQYTQPEMPKGYTYDLVNADVLLHRVKIQDGRIVLPEGTSYRVLVLPEDLTAMTPELLRKLEELVAQGMVMIGPKPTICLTLREGKSIKDFQRTADKLWAGTEEEIKYGKGRIFPKGILLGVLRTLGIGPDFEYSVRNPDGSVVWLHRKIGDGDIYFIANRQRRTEDIVASLRSVGKQPEVWDAETGEVLQAPVYSVNDGRLQLPIRLGPAQSVFVVLRKAAVAAPIQSLARDGATIVDAKPFPAECVGPYGELTNTFTISVWAKPDINLRVMPQESTNGAINETAKFYVVPTRPGDEYFGAGHTMMGLAAGRNGVFVVEKSTQGSPAVLVARMPLAGWTHLAVVYENGKPRLYVNGKLAREGLVSGLTVHPGVGVPPPTGMVYYHEGDMTKPEVFAEALGAEKIQALAEAGLPAPDAEQIPKLGLRPDGKVDALLWESGSYQLGEGSSVKVEVAPPVTLTNWQVNFPPDRGAPASITMPELTSFHRHSDPGVRYFSGTATYSNVLQVPLESLAGGRRVFLDLGRVEVIAEVLVNGREVGRLWKPPYRLDVTDAVHPGGNILEVRVTTLWPNRLIGDEQLPVENEYDADRHNILRLPDWYTQGKSKPTGGRTTFTTWQSYKSNEPLFESGLLGPVRVFNPVNSALTSTK